MSRTAKSAGTGSERLSPSPGPHAAVAFGLAPSKRHQAKQVLRNIKRRIAHANGSVPNESLGDWSASDAEDAVQHHGRTLGPGRASDQEPTESEDQPVDQVVVENDGVWHPSSSSKSKSDDDRASMGSRNDRRPSHAESNVSDRPSPRMPIASSKLWIKCVLF